ncbi:MAG TPA: methyltransferase domain-containing protein [Steroidobacteraceae bacterium]|jgi:ubiquinone/menaquinone biosynthesis C-methylase UbiE|nr:methyltransferase domain-containing protein [Steroidobacteraceae bacterium]
MESTDRIYVCPECKQSLDNYFCRHCSVRYPVRDGIPCFIPDSPSTERPDVRQVYDEIYRNHQDAWVDQGRSEEFVSYFCELARSRSQNRTLEIGCGEGALLAAMTATYKFGVDPSINALRRASSRSNAEWAVARSEQLPFPTASFDLVVTVGVMEHFEDPDAATHEIYRVLSQPGHYIALIQTDLSSWQRILLKFRQYAFPTFRPIQFARWVRKKLHNPIVQPFRRSLTIDSARQCIERSGLKVTEVITRSTHPSAPLAGRHVIILVASK